MAKRIHTNSPPRTRAELEAVYGQVWDTRQMAAEFTITGIITPDALVVRRKSDEAVGTMTFQDGPRLYFDFRPQPGSD